MWGPKAFVETPHIDSMAAEGALTMDWLESRLSLS